MERRGGVDEWTGEIQSKTARIFEEREEWQGNVGSEMSESDVLDFALFSSRCAFFFPCGLSQFSNTLLTKISHLTPHFL